MEGVGIDPKVTVVLCGTIVSKGIDIPKGTSDLYGKGWYYILIAGGLFILMLNFLQSFVFSKSYLSIT